MDGLLGRFDLYNTYGPSEATVCATYHRITNKENVSLIGKPVDNHCVLIVNDHNQIQPIGMPGEICIGGNGLTRGYLNQKELNTEKFISNPFDKGQRLYKTGDIGILQEDGNICFIGRKDEQIKINGYRVEIGEIEEALQQFDPINVAAVLFFEQDEVKALKAFYTGNQKIETGKLRSFLLELSLIHI